MRLTLLVTALTLSMCATAGASTLTATPSNFTTVYSSAQGGDTILLSAGAYPAFKGASKSSRIVVKTADGAAVTMAGAQFVGTSNITLQGIKFTSGVVMRDNATGNVLDGDTFDNLSPATWEGRVSINLGATGNVIKNSHFGNGGCSDGVFVGDASGNTIGPGNEFSGIKQGSCSAHVDAIQLYDGPKTTIVGNYFHDDDTHIMAPDGGDHSVITDNVFVAGGYVPTVQLGSHVGTQFVHNTVVGADIHMDSKTGTSASRDGILRDNVITRSGSNGGSFNTTNGSGCPTCVISYNLFGYSGDKAGSNAVVGVPVFVGGATPNTYAGFALASSSPGKANASDGLDRGVRVSGTVTPPPPTDTTPPQTTITTAPVDTTDTSATVTFSSSETGSTFECKLDAGAWSSCTTPKQYTSLAVGSHTVSVRATDIAGNVDATPATATWNVSAVPQPCDQTTAERDKALADLAVMTSERDKWKAQDLSDAAALADANAQLDQVRAQREDYRQRLEAAQAKIDAALADLK